MTRFIRVNAGDAFALVLGVTPEGQVGVHELRLGENVEYRCHQAAFPLVQMHLTGDDQDDHHGRKHLGGVAGAALRYAYHEEEQDLVKVHLQSERVAVTVHYSTRSGTALRCWNVVENRSDAAIGIEYISSFTLWGIDGDVAQWDTELTLHVPSNNWYGEAQWKPRTLADMGLSKVNSFTLDRVCIESTGTWSTLGHLPCAMLSNEKANTTMFWQIEHNGSWSWEIGDLRHHIYLQLSGPSENESRWWKQLGPGNTLETVPVAFGAVIGGVQEALGALTTYRRSLLRPCRDLVQLPVIFNDYMNCLDGDPTTAKLLPLIDAAANAGCEVFCIDAGWYSDGPWWDGVGEWLPSKARFPNGIREPLEHIKARGMTSGLWLELEVMGKHCALAQQWPDECFFMRHGQRVIDHQRYQLDYRHPVVLKHADDVLKRLVEGYGVGYIKMDYNINAGAGTNVAADSVGEGLLAHNRAYLDWLRSAFARYPNLTIENCGSGGLRMDYALLSQHSIQSVSDQTDYRLMAVIAASAASAATPEQCAIWSYPLRDGSREQVIFNMVNAMLLRVHQSGHLAELHPDNVALVHEGIRVYKQQVRHDIPNGIPVWPIGLPSFVSPQWLCFGLLVPQSHLHLAVWRCEAERDTVTIPMPFILTASNVKCAYPATAADQELSSLSTDGRALLVRFSATYMARLFHVTLG